MFSRPFVRSWNDGVLECARGGVELHAPLSLVLLLQRTFNAIWFESLCIIPMGLWFVGHCAIMVCSWSVWGRMYACAWLCVWMCAGGGRGNGHGCFISLSGWSIVASPYVETSNPPTPRRRHELDPQIPPSRQQRDYGGNGLIYFCEFTYFGVYRSNLA